MNMGRLARTQGAESMGREPLHKKVMSYGAIIVLLTFAGGVVGWYSQTGLHHLVREQTAETHSEREYHREKSMESSTPEEYTQRMRTGWWVGCALGGALGLGAVAFISRR